LPCIWSGCANSWSWHKAAVERSRAPGLKSSDPVRGKPRPSGRGGCRCLCVCAGVPVAVYPAPLWPVARIIARELASGPGRLRGPDRRQATARPAVWLRQGWDQAHQSQNTLFHGRALLVQTGFLGGCCCHARQYPCRESHKCALNSRASNCRVIRV